MQYSTVELARRIEDYVVNHLTEIWEESQGCAGAMVFELYTQIHSQSYGDQVTAGFFNKILSDLAKAGVIKIQNNKQLGNGIFLSEAMQKKQEKEKQNNDTDTLAGLNSTTSDKVSQ